MATATIWSRETQPAERLPRQPHRLRPNAGGGPASRPPPRLAQRPVLQQEPEVDERRGDQRQKQAADHRVRGTRDRRPSSRGRGEPYVGRPARSRDGDGGPRRGGWGRRPGSATVPRRARGSAGRSYPARRASASGRGGRATAASRGRRDTAPRSRSRRRAASAAAIGPVWGLSSSSRPTNRKARIGSRATRALSPVRVVQRAVGVQRRGAGAGEHAAARLDVVAAPGLEVGEGSEVVEHDVGGAVGAGREPGDDAVVAVGERAEAVVDVMDHVDDVAGEVSRRRVGPFRNPSRRCRRSARRGRRGSWAASGAG